jgi:hypothetical protein
VKREEKTKKQLEKQADAETWNDALKVFTALSEDKDVSRTKWGEVGYTEGRAIRYVYCIHGWGCTRIANAIGRNHKCIEAFVARHRLKRLRARIEQRVLEKGIVNLEKNFEGIMALNAQLAMQFLQHQIQNFNPDNIDYKAMKLSSEMARNYQMMLQIVRNKPTSINEHKHITDMEATSMLVDVLKKMHDDPLFDKNAFLRELGINPADVH